MPTRTFKVSREEARVIRDKARAEQSTESAFRRSRVVDTKPAKARRRVIKRHPVSRLLYDATDDGGPIVTHEQIKAALAEFPWDRSSARTLRLDSEAIRQRAFFPAADLRGAAYHRHLVAVLVTASTAARNSADSVGHPSITSRNPSTLLMVSLLDSASSWVRSCVSAV